MTRWNTCGNKGAAAVDGKRVAILGLGRSGLAIGRACLRLGALPLVFDEKPREALPKPEIVQEAETIGLPLELGWAGSFERSATDLLVTNPAVDRRHPKLRQAVSDGIEVISEVEFAYRISKAPIVAVTGTNGKSTTTVMTWLCLRACGEDAVLCGNLFGSGYDEVPLTEAALHSTGDQILVAEISSFGLEWVSEFRPVAAGITNITPDHLDRYESFAEYAATKHLVFSRMGEGDVAVVRANDPEVLPPCSDTIRYRPRRERQQSPTERDDATDCPLVLTFGAHGEHALVGELELRVLHQSVPLDELPFDEPHNRQNASMAALLAYGAIRHRALRFPESAAGQLLRDAEEAERARRSAGQTVYDRRVPEEDPFLVAPPVLLDGLKAFRGLAHRMEYLGEKGRVRVVNNSMCTNPDAVVKSAQSLRDPAHLLIGGANKKLDFKPLRHYLANGRHRAYLYGRDAESLDVMLGGGHPRFSTLEEAFHAAALAASPGETIMLSPGCASTDGFRDFRERGNLFKKIAQEWLRP